MNGVKCAAEPTEETRVGVTRGPADRRGTGEGNPEVLNHIADHYRSTSPLQQAVPVKAFLHHLTPEQVEPVLAELLDTGALVAGPGGTVTLAAELRARLINRQTLTAWLNEAKGAPGQLEDVLLAGIRGELRDLLRACLTADASQDLADVAVSIAAVLAMADLDPDAIDVLAGIRGSAEQLLRQLATVPEGSCRSLKELQAKLRYPQIAAAIGTGRP